MDWSLQLFHYCERGSDPSFWAEPFNAISNGAFAIAALAAWMQLSRVSAPKGLADGDRVTLALIAMVGAIGAGSFLFHTAATRWAWALDTGSIVVFTFAYLGFALRRFGNASWITIGACFGLMIAALAASRALPCSPDLLPVTAAAGRPCFNGSLGYLPVIAAMALVGGWLGMQGHPAAWPIAAAAVIFAISLGLRTLDLEVCALTVLLGKARGTHAAWHLLNGLAIYCLLVAAVRYGGRAGAERDRIASQDLHRAP